MLFAPKAGGVCYEFTPVWQDTVWVDDYTMPIFLCAGKVSPDAWTGSPPEPPRQPLLYLLDVSMTIPEVSYRLPYHGSTSAWPPNDLIMRQQYGSGWGSYGNVSYSSNPSTLSLTSGYYQGTLSGSPQWPSTTPVNIVTTPTAMHGYIGSSGSLGLSFFSNTPGMAYQVYSGTGGHYIVKNFKPQGLFGGWMPKLPSIPDPPMGPLPYPGGAGSY